MATLVESGLMFKIVQVLDAPLVAGAGTGPDALPTVTAPGARAVRIVTAWAVHAEAVAARVMYALSIP